MATATFYVLYAGLTKTFNFALWFCIGLMLLETLVLLVNKWTCPLTPMAAKYTAERAENFDIYLPRIIAKYNKQIFGTVWALGIVLVVYNLLTKYRAN
jgi:hypothetical protein